MIPGDSSVVIIVDDDKSDGDDGIADNKEKSKKKIKKNGGGDDDDDIIMCVEEEKEKEEAKKSGRKLNESMKRPSIVKQQNPEKRQAVVHEANQCQDVLVRLTNSFDSGSFFAVRTNSKRNKTVSKNSADLPIVIDDCDLSPCSVSNPIETSFQKQHTSSPQSCFMALDHVRQLSDTESAALTLNGDTSTLGFAPVTDLNRMWNDLMAEINCLPCRIDKPLPSLSSVLNSSVSEIPRMVISVDKVVHVLSECTQTMNEVSIDELAKEILRIRNKYSDDTRKSLLWAELYHPRKPKFVCGCESARESLSKWLSVWADLIDAAAAAAQEAEEKAKKKKEQEERWATSNCFDASYLIVSDKKWLEACHEEQLKKMKSRICVIHGDGCCGKTAMVYACAKERGMEVIEMNSSECRSSAYVLQTVADTAETRQLVSTAPKNTELPTKKSKRKRKTRRRLFLFEDADVVLDPDTGFFGALTKLAEASDYPIVLTCRHITRDLSLFSKSTKALVIQMTPAAIDEIVIHASLIGLSEMTELQYTDERSKKETNGIVDGSRVLVRSFFENVSTIAKSLPKDRGLKGLLSYLQTCSFSMMTTKPITEPRVWGIGDFPKREQDSLESQLETAHLEGLDCGFDCWLQCAEGSSLEEVYNNSCMFSDLDSFGSSPDTFMWTMPEGTLPLWHRSSKLSTSFEASVLRRFRSFARSWHIDDRNTVPVRYLNHGCSTVPCIPTVLIPKPRLIFGYSRACRPMPSVNITLLKRLDGALSIEWSAEILPSLRRIQLLEQTRKRAKLKRHFFHHLGQFTDEDLDQIQRTCFP